jgi:Frataxin-like domain
MSSRPLLMRRLAARGSSGCSRRSYGWKRLTLTESWWHRGVSLFHTSTPSPLRRFRHRGNHDSQQPSIPLSSFARLVLHVHNHGEFERAAQALLDQIHEALRPLQAINDPFVLVRSFRQATADNVVVPPTGPTRPWYTSTAAPEAETAATTAIEPDSDDDDDETDQDVLYLDLGPVHGAYTLQVDYSISRVLLTSPLSGSLLYYCSQEAGSDDYAWRSEDDGHVLQGLLVRDLIRQIQGVPQL